MNKPRQQYVPVSNESLGKYIDLSNEAPKNQRTPASKTGGTKKPQSTDQPAHREFLGINFECCRVYSRIFINDEETKFQGNCPRCGKFVQFEIDPNGTDARFFDVS
jgi:hypothetical protein